ncbi:MAG: hypothetical protein AAB646_01690 [Patescibacteria group bacterium]
MNSENLGPEAEKAVEEAVQELIKENSLFIGYIKAEFSDRLDNEGIDIMVFVIGGFVLPIQVRSTMRRIHRFRKIHPLVRFVLFIKKPGLTDPNSAKYRRTLDYIKRKITRFAERAVKGYLDIDGQS